MEETKLF